MSTTCSCTECVYSPKSNKNNDKIEKFYRSKYLPRRNRALLEKLVKTRAAYDELRDQILSGRTYHVDSENSFFGSDDINTPDQSVIKIVDLVDKGQFPLLQSSVNLHNECCGCCYCSSKNKIKKHRKGRQALPTDYQLRKHLEYQKQKTRRERNAVKFSTNRSEPCICTLKFSDLKKIPRKIRNISSEEIFQKTRNRVRESLRSFQTHVSSKKIFKRKPKKYKEPVNSDDDDELSFAIQPPKKLKKKQKSIRESLRSFQTHISSKEKFKRKQKQKKHKEPVKCECILDERIGDFESFDSYYEKPSLTKRSKIKVKQARDKFRDGIRSSVSKLGNAFRIKKDSIMLFKEKLKRKKDLEPWTCDPDFCVPNLDECIPEECYEKVKLREARKMQKQQTELKERSYQSQVSVISLKIDPKQQKKELRPENKRKSRIDKVICKCRTKTRSKSSMTRRRRQRTQESMSDSIITSSNKKTDTLSERIPNKEYHSQYSMNESDNFPTASRKQAVKISSSFKFEIEFYRDKGRSIQNEPNRTESEYDSEKQDQHYKDAREKDKVLKYNNARAQHTIRVRKISTQTIDISSAEKLPFPRECDPFMCVPGKCNPKKCAAILLKQSQGNHELQRCFCTLHLQKTPKRQDKKQSMTRPIKLEQVSDSISTQTKKNYDCEPYVCIPGECDPMICYERIKKRSSIKNKSINTLTEHIKRRDVKVSSTTKKDSVGTKGRAPKQRKRFSRQKSEPPSLPVETSLSSSTMLNRQAVRIGSSFKFDIEFYKNTNNPDKNLSEPKDSIKNENTDENKNLKSLHGRDSESTGKSKHSDVKKSLLKRCFCTKQFRKKPKVKIKQIKRRSKMIMTDAKDKKSRRHQTKVVECECDYELEKPFVKTKASMTSSVESYVIPPANHQSRNLLPYECEPLFCSPGKCDPYICLKRIKSRNVKQIKTHSKDISNMPKKTTSTVTSIGNKNPSRKVQAVRATRRKKIGHDTKVQESNLNKKEAYISKSSPSPPRQGVRIGSSFRFDIEFYKTNKLPKSTVLEKKEETKINRNSEVVKKPKLTQKPKTRGIGDFAEVKSQTSGTKDNVKSKMSLITPLQRCFCTLKFNKKPKQKVKKKVSKATTVSSRMRMIICKCKVASTQTPKQTGKSKLNEERSYNIAARSNLLPYECEPNFCVPGECDPYVCYERIKSRNMLKRCFCTLKFHKSPKNRGSATRLKKDQKTAGTETVQEKHRGHKLLPYECSPGVCDPENCNPYKCLELIKKRNAINISHRDQIVSTHKPVKKSSFSETSRTGKRSQSTLNISEQRAHIDKHTKTRRDRHRQQKHAIKNKNTLPSNSSFPPHSKPRQAVRIGSNFSFNIEFSKNKTGNIKHQRYRTSSDNYVSSSDKKKKQVRRVHVNESLNKQSKQKRCFCTLKFHKDGRRNKDNSLNNSEISREMNYQKPGKREVVEITRETQHKRHRRQRPQANMISITREERYLKQKGVQKPPVEQPKVTVPKPQETVVITREVKPQAPPPVEYEYVYRTIKYTPDGQPIVTDVNASQVDVNKLAAAGQIISK